jgi:hypothetical protein
METQNGDKLHRISLRAYVVRVDGPADKNNHKVGLVFTE